MLSIAWCHLYDTPSLRSQAGKVFNIHSWPKNVWQHCWVVQSSARRRLSVNRFSQKWLFRLNNWCALFPADIDLKSWQFSYINMGSLELGPTLAKILNTISVCYGDKLWAQRKSHTQSLQKHWRRVLRKTQMFWPKDHEWCQSKIVSNVTRFHMHSVYKKSHVEYQLFIWF